MTASPDLAMAEPRALLGDRVLRSLRRNGWTIGLFVLLAGMLLLTRAIQPDYGASGIDSLARAALPVAFAAVAQAVVVISGGIDLSVGSMMALTNVAAAAMMAWLVGTTCSEKPGATLRPRRIAAAACRSSSRPDAHEPR